MPQDRIAAHPILQVSEVGEFIRFSSCLRRAKLSFNGRAEARTLPFYSRLENTLDVVLRDRGLAIEGAWERQLNGASYTTLGQGRREAPLLLEDLLTDLQEVGPDARFYGREVSLNGEIGVFAVEGRMDFVVLVWPDGAPKLRIVEGKASRRDKTYQRMQIAAYVLLARQVVARGSYVIAGHTLTPTDVEGIVARVDEDLREPQDILGATPLDLSSAIDDLHRLLGAEGPFARAAEQPLDALPFRLEPKCDACVFNVHCFPEAAIKRRLQLLGPSHSAARALERAGLFTIDQLAELTPEAEAVELLRADDGLGEDPLRLAARAVARRKMLPGGREQEGFAVTPLPMSGSSQCPEHQIEGAELVRIFLNVDYDYVEDRIASVAAYVVRSPRELHTPFEDPGAGFRPAPGGFEQVPGSPTNFPLSGIKVSQFKSTPWTGSSAEDAAAERQLIESFFQSLIEAIADVAATDTAPLHFYVWSANEMTRLMEACARGGPSLIRHLSELLGCREGREQLIFTSLQAEIDRRYGLGWTGRGLGVATSLSWFGRRFHWVRNVRGSAVELDRVFHQDVFDFASTLAVRDGGWAEDGDANSEMQRFEIRSRFNDSLSMPYYAVLWGQLSSEDARWVEEPLVRAAIRRYELVCEHPGLLRAYLETRCEALRFLEERCKKSSRIEKPAFSLRDLGGFRLGINSPRDAAIDVLRIDWQVKYNDWRASQALSVGERVAVGRCLPLCEVTGDQQRLSARISAETCSLSLGALKRRYADGEGSFVRLMPWTGDAARPAELSGGITCIIESVDWSRGRVRLSPHRKMQGDHYRLYNAPFAPMGFAILEQSATDFVAPRVQRRLRTTSGNHVDPWFNISAPVVTAAPQLNGERIGHIDQALAAWRIPESPDYGLLDEQRVAAVRGCTARIQALQGPPGTGKTATTAASIFARISASAGPRDVVLLAGPTHRAVDTMVERLANWEPSLRRAFNAEGVEPPSLRIVRLDPRPETKNLPENVETIPVPERVGEATALINTPNGVTLVCGTVSALLKMEEKLGARASFNAMLLVVDEASMMVFPHLLSLASLIAPDARIMLAGDNRQLSPILSHAWDREDRPPTIQFQPFLSAYEVAARVGEAVIGLPNSDELVLVSRLRYTFRLAPAHRALVAKLYRLQDGLELEGRDYPPGATPAAPGHPFSCVWEDENGLLLVLHDEQESRKENAVEREIVRQILSACPNAPNGSVAILSPHRAQRGLLQEELGSMASVAVIDTVERLQGGQAATVIVSATASDPNQIQSAEDFLLNLNRANVAFSRAENRLIVLASRTLVDHIAADLETYEAAMLWKELRSVCSERLSEIEIQGVRVSIHGVPVQAPEPELDV